MKVRYVLEKYEIFIAAKNKLFPTVFFKILKILVGFLNKISEVKYFFLAFILLNHLEHYDCNNNNNNDNDLFAFHINLHGSSG